MRSPWRFALSAALLASSAGAETLITTGRFDDPADVDPGWLELDVEGEMTWDGTRDADDCPASGVAELVNSAVAAGAAVRFVTCAPVVPPGTTLHLGASVYFPTQARDGQATLTVHWMDAGACAGASLGDVSTPAALSTLEEQWIGVEVSAGSPDGTASAMLVLTLIKDLAGSSLTARLDEVFLAQTADVFLDGVEVGASCRWSFEALGGP